MLVIITGWSKVKSFFDKEPIAKARSSVKRNTHTIRFAILSAYLVVTLITLALMYVYNVGILTENLNTEKKSNLYAKANIIAQSTAAAWDSNDEQVMNLRIEDIINRRLAGTDIRGVVINTSYDVLHDNNREANMTGKVFMRDVLKHALDGEQADSVFEADNGSTLTVAVPVEYDGKVVGGVYLAENLSTISETVAAIQRSLVFFSIIILFIIGLISVGISYIVTKPLGEFTEVARAISKGDFSRRVNVGGTLEIKEMSQAFNFMCDELNALDEKRKNFVSDVSHELKTPMAGIKLLCDSLVQAENPDISTIREFLNDMSEEIDRLTRLINRLLELSRLDSGAQLSLSQVDMAELCKGVVRGLATIAAEKNINLEFSYTGENRLLFVDYDKMYESVYNITVNAIKYTPENGDVSMRLDISDTEFIIEVEDNGPGIPDGEKTKVFDRFYRLDDSRARDTGGTGLGLAITKEAVLLHNGHVEVVDAEPCGSIFRIVVPVRNESI